MAIPRSKDGALSRAKAMPSAKLSPGNRFKFRSDKGMCRWRATRAAVPRERAQGQSPRDVVGPRAFVGRPGKAELPSLLRLDRARPRESDLCTSNDIDGTPSNDACDDGTVRRSKWDVQLQDYRLLAHWICMFQFKPLQSFGNHLPGKRHLQTSSWPLWKLKLDPLQFTARSGLTVTLGK
jgi:hypothetical protein